MSIVSPWGFGINRAEIQQLVRELTIQATGFDPSRVFLTDAAARLPQLERSSAAIQLADPIRVQETGDCQRVWPSKEQWSVTVTSNADGTYSIVVLGISYDFVALGDSITAIRDGLIVVIGVPVGFTAVAVNGDQIQITSTIDGTRLQVTAAPASLVASKSRGNGFIRNLRHFECQCNITVNGLMDLEAPATTQGGQSIADIVEMVFSQREMTEKMRDCGHVPVRISRLFTAGPLNKQQLNQSTVQVIIATTGRLDVDIQSATEIPLSVTATQ